jgi:hypothetical protein
MQGHPILGRKEPETPRETNAFEVAAALAQLPLAIIALTQAKTVTALGILAVGVLLFLFAVRKTIGRRYRARRDRKHDNRASLAALPQLRALSRAFEKLVDINDDKNLYALLRRALENYANAFDQLHVPSPNVYSEMMRNVKNRLDDQPAGKTEVFRVLDEFYTVLGAHSDDWMVPVFRSMPPSIKEMLKPDARAAVNSYRERYIAFHTDFGKFVEDLTASMYGGHLPRQFYVYRPDALN